MLVYSVAVLESRLWMWILASGSTQANLPQDSGTNRNTAAAAATCAELPASCSLTVNHVLILDCQAHHTLLIH